MIIRLLMSLLLIALILPTLVIGCSNTKIAEKENSVIQKAAIPPIDASAPIETETATFALG